MTQFWLQLFFMLIVIFISAEIFTNALEFLGERLGISEGVVGSVFAAIATAIPETTVPIIAIISGTADKTMNEEISVGAILGAPLMLATLAMFIMSCAAILKRGITGQIKPEKKGFLRDLNFFIYAFIFASIAMYIPHHNILMRGMIGVILVLIYIVYLYFTFKASKKLVEDGHGVTAHGPLMITKIGLPSNMSTVLIQLISGFALLVIGAKGFINAVGHLSQLLQISALLISLLIIPVATELPEKINSVLWVRRGKDTLAVGNITGAMVFQGTLLPALGVMMTPWAPNKEVVIGMVITLLAALWLRISAQFMRLAIWVFWVNGLLYATYLYLTLGR